MARQTGLDRNTIRRYVRVAEKCGLDEKAGKVALTDEKLAEIVGRLRLPEAAPPPGDAWARCEARRDFIKKQRDDGVQLTKVCRFLVRQNAPVPYATLHRFAVKELDFGRSAPTIPVADCEPGAEVQVDTGWMTLLEPDLFGKRRRFRAWIFTSVYSRHRFVYPCFEEPTKTAIEACEAAWEFFGGVFAVLIPDNTKAIVQEADPLKPLINEAFLEYAQKRGFHVDPARSKSPKDKARVERSVQTVREDCFRAEHLQTLDDARRRARHWCLEEYGMRRHSTTQRLPREAFEADERPHLKTAPSAPYEVPIYCEVKVGPDQHAAVAKAIYSLPFEFRGKRLRARADRTTIRFYEKGTLVKAHPRRPPGGRSTDPSDFPPEKAAYALRDTAFLLRQAEEKGPHVLAFAKALPRRPAALGPDAAVLRAPRPLQAIRRRARGRDLQGRARSRDARGPSSRANAQVRSPAGVRGCGRPQQRRSARALPASREPVRASPRIPRGGWHQGEGHMTTDTVSSDLKTALHRLKLSGLLHTLPERLALAKSQKMPYQDLLLLLLSDEISRRDGQPATIRAQRGKLDPTMQLEAWDESAKVTFDKMVLNELVSLRFIEKHAHVAIVGPVGVGKTFLAHALGHVACRRGFSVLATRGDQMLKTLRHARLDNSYEAELLVVDDFGLDRMDATESRDAYEIFTERHRAGSMIVTSNRGPDEWLGTFADPVRAQSAIERFSGNAYDLVIEGESYRARQKPSLHGGVRAAPAAKRSRGRAGEAAA